MLWIFIGLAVVALVVVSMRNRDAPEQFKRHHHRGDSSCAGHYRRKKALFMKQQLANVQPHVHDRDEGEVETFVPLYRAVPGEWGQFQWSQQIDRPLYDPDCYDQARDRCVGSPSPVNCFNHYYARCTSPYTGAGLLPY